MNFYNVFHDINFFSYHETLFQIINSKLKLVNESFLANKLSLNAKKSMFFQFCPVATVNHDTP